MRARLKEARRRELLTNVDFLMTSYCDGCFLHKQLKQEGGRRVAHHFCISQCTVGEKLKEFGKKLN
ncbi:MAG TPA: zinc-finger domain-containing protein [Neobacillus sp.]